MAGSCQSMCNRRERCANGNARPAADVEPGAICATAFSGTTSLYLHRHTPCLTASESRAATGICHGAEGMSWVAGESSEKLSRHL